MSERKTAAAYIRVSTEEQTELSPESQWEAIRNYSLQRGYSVPEEYVFIDEGISGRTAANRPAFRRMIAAARRAAHPFDCILVWKFSRFARNQEESVFYKAMLKRERVDVVSVSEPLIEGPFGGLVERILEWMDEYYSVRLSGEVRRSMTLNARRGVRQIAPPFGYALARGADGKWVMVPEAREAELVREIFARWNAGEGPRTIARALNDADARTHRGNRFENRSVEYILRNPVYIGKLRWTPDRKIRRDFNYPGAILADASHEPIVDAATWDAAQKRIRAVKERHGYRERPARERRDWFSGLIRCAACGATLTFAKPSALRCNNYARGRCQASQRVNLEWLRGALTGRLRDDTRGARINCRLFRDNAEGEIERLTRALAALDRRMSRCREAYEAGADSLEEYRKRRETLEQEMASTRRQLYELRRAADGASFDALLRDPAALLECTDVDGERKREALRGVLASCTFDRERMTLRIVYRVTLP